MSTPNASLTPGGAETEISDLGEFALIERLIQPFGLRRGSTRKGPGDDAAVLDYEGMLPLVSNDLFTEGIHFDFTYTPLQHLGYKCVVAAISDILAMNGIPEQVLISMAVTNRFTVEMLETLYAGIRQACVAYEVDLAGGDIVSGKSGLTISVTAVGSVAAGQEVYRSGLKPNDLICVTGDLGGAYMGLQLLEREKQVFKQNPEVQPQLDSYPYILQRQLRPEVRLDVVEYFARENILPTAMIDISDGLSSELLHLSKQSEVGLRIFEDKIPIADETRNAARAFKLDPSMCALNGGEDYELIIGLPATMHELVDNNPDIKPIGYAVDVKEGCRLITRNGNEHELVAQGWQSAG